MNNNKDFSEQLGDLFDELSLDQAGNLIDNQIAPSKEELQEEVIENIKKSNIEVDKKILEELKTKQGEGEDNLVDYLRETYGLKYTEEVREELDLEVVGPEEPRENYLKPEVRQPEVKAESYIDSLGDRLANVLNKTGMRTRTERKEAELTESLEARVDAIQSQLGMLRTSLLEAAGNTIVSGIGQGGDGQSPGSGETRLNRLDDVHIPLKTSTTRSIAPAGLSGDSRYEIEDGSVLVWDSSIYPDGGWTVVPGDEIGGGGIDEIADVEPVFGKIWNGNTFNTEATLYFGTFKEYEEDTDPGADPANKPNAVGHPVVDDVVSFSYVVSTDAEEFDGNIGVYNTVWYIVGAKNAVGTPLGVKTAYPSPVLSTTQDIKEVNDPDDTTNKIPIYGAYFRDGVDGNVIDPDDSDGLDGLIVGHLTGCRETAGPAIMYWGTTEDYSHIVENGPRPNDPQVTPVLTNNRPTIAEKIISCVGKVVENSTDILWEIVYADAEGGIRTTEHQAPATSNDTDNGGFQGPFLYASGSPCVSGSLSRVRTDDVYLAKIDDLSTTFSEINRLYGTIPIDLTQFEFQEDYNEFVATALLDLHQLKPTMLVAAYTPDLAYPDVETVPNYTVDGIHDLYVPIEGDLWFDPADNTLRAVKNVQYLFDPDPRSDRPDFTAEWVVISGNDTEVSTREVTLFNTLAAYEYFQEYKPELTEEEFLEFFPLQTQEDLNIFNLDLLTQLKENKPTIHVCENIFDVTDTITRHEKNIDPDTKEWDGTWEEGEPVEVAYIPKQGDIWVKSDTYTIYVADIRNEDPDVPPENPSFDIIIPRNGNPGYPYTDNDGNYLIWVEIGGGGEGGNKIYIQTTPPLNVYKGDLWVEDTTYYVYVYQGETWVALTGDQSALGKNFRIHVSENPPMDPETGDCWYNLDDSELRIFIIDDDGTGNSGWFPVSSGGISINKFEEQQTRSYLNFQIQDLNARLAALETVQQSTVNDGSNYTFPMVDEQLELQMNLGTDVLENIINDGYNSSY